MATMKEISEQIKQVGSDYITRKNAESNLTQISEEKVQKGIEIESKEHPGFSPEVIRQLVTDHLNQDANYYDNENPEVDRQQLNKFRARLVSNESLKKAHQEKIASYSDYQKWKTVQSKLPSSLRYATQSFEDEIGWEKNDPTERGNSIIEVMKRAFNSPQESEEIEKALKKV